MNEILNQILSELQQLKVAQDKVNSRLDNIEQNMVTKADHLENVLAEKQKDIISLIKLTYNQIDEKLDKIYDEIEFLNHKEKLNEKEIFMLKKNIQIIK